MRAAVYDRRAPEGIRTAEGLPAPRLRGAGRALVRVRAAGVNPVDAKFVFADKLPAAWEGLARRSVQGGVVGFDFSGQVLQASPGAPVAGCRSPTPPAAAA